MWTSKCLRGKCKANTTECYRRYLSEVEDAIPKDIRKVWNSAKLNMQSGSCTRALPGKPTNITQTYTTTHTTPGKPTNITQTHITPGKPKNITQTHTTPGKPTGTHNTSHNTRQTHKHTQHHANPQTFLKFMHLPRPKTPWTDADSEKYFSSVYTPPTGNTRSRYFNNIDTWCIWCFTKEEVKRNLDGLNRDKGWGLGGIPYCVLRSQTLLTGRSSSVIVLGYHVCISGMANTPYSKMVSLLNIWRLKKY